MEDLRFKIKSISIPSVYHIIDNLDIYELMYLDDFVNDLNKKRGKKHFITMIESDEKGLRFITAYDNSYLN